MVDGRLVVGYLRLASLGQTADQDGEIADLVARLRELVWLRVGDAVLTVVDDARAAQDALARIARAIEEAGRHDPAFAREVTGLCDEIARRGALPAPWSTPSLTCPRCGEDTRPERAFCDHCGAFLEWASGSTPADSPPAEAPRDEQTAPAVSAPAADDAGPERTVRAPSTSAAHTRWPLRRSRSARGRMKITIDGSSQLEMSGSTLWSQQHAQAMIDDALSTYVQRGRLLFNPPEQMRQGRVERVRVAIAQHGGLDAQLRALAPGADDAAIHDVETTPFMEVDLQGSAFSIVSLQAGNTAEQLLRPTAVWQFDVTPESRGTHPLQLRVAMRIPLSDREERVSLPALERTIRVRVDATYSGRRFVRAHWQWIAATVAGLGGALGAWIKLFQD